MKKEENCGCDCENEPTKSEKEWMYLESLSKRIEIAERLLMLRSHDEKPLYTDEWVKENILKLDDK